MKKSAALVSLTIALFPLTALANDDANACKPDVFRLCSAEIPSRDRITECLAKKKRQLSSACYQVFNRRPTKHAKPAQSDQPRAAQYEPGYLR